MKPERVILSKGVVYILVKAAIRGYEARYKEERLGILLGKFQNKVATVKYAKVYRGGARSRTSAGVNPAPFAKRVQELCRRHKSEFLGTFHTHNEVALSISSALSIEDRDHLCSDPPSIVELIIAVWASDSPSYKSKRYLQGESDGYRFRIAGYQMCSPFRLIPVFSDDATE
jgi:proteasome lid subunit RPN8/RPN11